MDKEILKERWEDIKKQIKNSHVDEKKIFEKLDEEDNYSAIHHAVLSNNYDACVQLLPVSKKKAGGYFLNNFW